MKVEIPSIKVASGEKMQSPLFLQTDKTGGSIYTTKIATHDGLYEVDAIEFMKALEYLFKCATRKDSTGQ